MAKKSKLKDNETQIASKLGITLTGAWNERDCALIAGYCSTAYLESQLASNENWSREWKSAVKEELTERYLLGKQCQKI